jgi:hypothetical protein
MFKEANMAVNVFEVVKPLLQKFQEVIIDELLNELPPMHDT